MRISSGLVMPCARHCWRSTFICLRMAMAMDTAFTASFFAPLLLGSPKNTITQSPMNLSMVPPYFRQVFGFQFFGQLGKALDVGEKHRELLALGFQAHALLAGEDRFPHLW